MVPLAPFLGVMGVAPAAGPCSTIEPGLHGGNLDCRDAIAGTVLRLPIQVAGALFSCGDGHAAQGDGEVCVTALECALTARLRFELERGRALPGPLLETPDAWMTLASAPTVEDAARAAVEAMLALICERTSLDRAAAYALASLAVDVRINQLVNGTQMGVRAVLAKSVLGDAGQTAVNADLLA
jgi:acetamidase/formamidase